MNTASVEQVANAVLYEGYLLYPYRASALKNRVVYPKSHSEAHEGSDPWLMQTECLALGDGATRIRIKVRFLRLVERIGAEEHSTPWQEAAESEIAVPECCFAGFLANPLRRPFSLPEGFTTENCVSRRQRNIEGIVEARAEEIEERVWRISIRIENLTPFGTADSANREDVLLQSLVSAHTILRVRDGAFVSLLDPPEACREAVALCQNIGTWPVLAGGSAQRDTILSSPIILYDYPQVAPESPGELFDGTEIDEILTLRILTMTDEEKCEARRTDERARKILDRTETLPPETLMKLHGAMRSAVPVAEDP
jgi:hypothetical protein